MLKYILNYSVAMHFQNNEISIKMQKHHVSINIQTDTQTHVNFFSLQ